MKLFVFPRWANKTRQIAGIALGGAPIYLTAFVWYGFSPKTTDVGYQPEQPVPYSHALHAGELGIDCRYCHTFVDRSEHSNVPHTEVCMSCHSMVRADDPQLAAVKESYESGQPIPWVRVHETPDYVFFNHSVHVNRGISCYSCHTDVNNMSVVYHAQPLSMSWCLDCHRHPELHLRPDRRARYETVAQVLAAAQRKFRGLVEQQRGIDHLVDHAHRLG